MHKYLQRKQEAEWKLLAAILIIVNTEAVNVGGHENVFIGLRTTDCQIYYTSKIKLLLHSVIIMTGLMHFRNLIHAFIAYNSG